ncbi:MAG: hypothetical protein HUU35_07930, partial [Armatimonadetes bacterium]|nr:hypothetical protein [Armatimonadota bacterium]
SRAAAKALEPPDLLRRGLVIIRYHASDRRWQVGPLKESIARAYDEASAYTTRWGVWADGLEVLVHDNYEAMAAALPRQGVTPPAFAAAATVGRRIHTVPQTDELFRIARHQVAHAVVNALTEDGLPPPLWLSEGLAWSAQETTTVSKMAEINIRRGRMLTVPQINDPVVFYDRRNADQANGQAELMTEAFIQRYGLAPIVPLLQNIGWGITPDQAFARATSLTQEQFLTAWVQGRLGR